MLWWEEELERLRKEQAPSRDLRPTLQLPVPDYRLDQEEPAPPGNDPEDHGVLIIDR